MKVFSPYIATTEQLCQGIWHVASVTKENSVLDGDNLIYKETASIAPEYVARDINLWNYQTRS